MNPKVIIGIDPGDVHTGVCALSLDEEQKISMILEQTFDDRFQFLAWFKDETSSWGMFDLDSPYDKTEHYVVVEDWRLFNTTEFKSNDRIIAVRVIGMVEAVLGREPYYQMPGIKVPTEIHLGHLLPAKMRPDIKIFKQTQHSKDAALHALHFCHKILGIALC